MVPVGRNCAELVRGLHLDSRLRGNDNHRAQRSVDGEAAR